MVKELSIIEIILGVINVCIHVAFSTWGLRDLVSGSICLHVFVLSEAI